MNLDNDEALAQAWIALQRAHVQKESVDRLFWAHEALDELCDEAPEECLRILLVILARDSSDFIAANVGAGPLENLLCRHGEQILGKIESAASKNDRFRAALSSVWRNTMDDQVWARVQAAVAARQ